MSVDSRSVSGQGGFDRAVVLKQSDISTESGGIMISIPVNMSKRNQVLNRRFLVG